MALPNLPRTSPEDTFIDREAPEDDEVTFVRRKEEPEDKGPPTPADLARLDMAKRSLRVLGHCEDVPRPCPFVSCRHNLYLDVDPRTGAVTMNFPLLEPGDMPANGSCAMDVVAHRGMSEAAIAELMNEGREQVETIVRKNAQVLREGLQEYREHSTAGEEGASPLGALASAMQGGVEKGLAEDEEDRSGRVLPDRLFFHELPGHHQMAKNAAIGNPEAGSHGLRVADVDDEEYGRAIWKVYERTSRAMANELEIALASASEDEARSKLVKMELDDAEIERRVKRARELRAEAATGGHGKRRRPRRG
jgi:hypothetical protein